MTDDMAILETKKEKNRHGFFLFMGAGFLGFIVFIINLLKCNIDTDWLSWIYYIPTSLGHASLFALVLYLLIYVPFSFVLKSHKIPSIVFIVLGVVLQTILILNVFVFSFYRFHINGFVVELILHAGKETFVFETKLYIQFALFIIFAAILPYVLVFLFAKKWSRRPRKKQIIAISICLIICVLFSHLGHAFAAALRQPSIQKAAMALPYFFPLRMNRFLEKMGISAQDEIDRLKATHTYGSDIAYPIHPIVVKDFIPNHNILFIAIDSWNPKAFDSVSTPNIYRLASQYEYFSNHNSSSNGTRGSLFGIFFGLPLSYQTDFGASKKSPVLIEQLVNRNYAIQVFPSGTLPAPPFHEILFRKAPHVHSRIEGNTAFERDQKITQLAIEHMNEWKGKKPFFSFVFYDLPHAISLPKEYLKFQPSWTEANYLTLKNDTNPEPFFNLYRNCVYQVDQQIGILLEYVQNHGLMDNTVIVITGDHGQEFNESRKNYWGHGGNFSKWQIHIPLIIYEPGMKQSKHFSHMTTHYDIVPTFMKRYLGVENPSTDFSIGYDLYETTSRYPHIVGDHVNYGFIFENIIATTNHLGAMMVTDNDLNDLPRSAINIKELQKAIEKKNMFYK
ncbi:MAG: sulfatase-like hydrolase/transferase [Cystobacterineae bacterium]|nr:sulfatase-like hydrolase/transferase [Cystobacterineae bacterium]